jgi:glycosyltransferase involved in cell wall biosynthesis
MPGPSLNNGTPLRILELRSVFGTGGGPEKTILLGTARSDPSRYVVTVCYIRDERDPVFHIDRRAQHLSVDYAEVVERHSFDPRTWRQLTALVRDRGIRIVHAHDYKTDLLALMLARRFGVIPLATAHGWTGHSTRERWIYYPADRWLLARYPCVIAVSTDVKQALIRAGARAGNIRVVLNGIDPQAFERNHERRDAARSRCGLTSGDLAIGAVGRLVTQKRFDVLIRAFSDVVAAFPHARLLIAGDGPLRSALASQIADSGLADSCRLLGHVDDVRLLHDALDVFVQSSDYEGTPNSVLEAMALETPIVATDAGGTAELARHDIEALIVPAMDAPALAHALRGVLSDPASAAERTAAARRRIMTELSFEHRMQQVDRIYDELAARFPPGGPAARHVEITS